MPLSVLSGEQSGGQSPLATLASGASLSGIVISDILLRRAFQRVGLVFPSSLAGMMGLFAGTSLRPALSQEASARFHVVGEGVDAEGTESFEPLLWAGCGRLGL